MRKRSRRVEPETNTASGQSGNWARDLRISSLKHSASCELTSWMKYKRLSDSLTNLTDWMSRTYIRWWPGTAYQWHYIFIISRQAEGVHLLLVKKKKQKCQFTTYTGNGSMHMVGWSNSHQLEYIIVLFAFCLVLVCPSTNHSRISPISFFLWLRCHCFYGGWFSFCVMKRYECTSINSHYACRASTSVYVFWNSTVC